jgi:hypothetical protein
VQAVKTGVDSSPAIRGRPNDRFLGAMPKESFPNLCRISLIQSVQFPDNGPHWLQPTIST